MPTLKDRLKLNSPVRRRDGSDVLSRFIEQLKRDNEEMMTKALLELKQEIQNELSKGQEDKIFGDLEPAKQLAKQTAEEVIQDFKNDANNKIQSVISEVKESKENQEVSTGSFIKEALGTLKNSIESALTSMSSTMSGELQSVIGKFNSHVEKHKKELRGEPGVQGEPGVDSVGEKGDTGSDGSSDTPNQVIEKVNKARNKIPISKIMGLDEMFVSLKRTISNISTKKGGGSGGMGNLVTFSFSGDGSTTAFTLSSNVAGNNLAIWCYYNSAWMQPTVHLNVVGTTMTMTFTPANGTILEGFYIRT